MYDADARLFEADALNPNFDKYPLLQKSTGFEGVANEGDLVFIPCDSIHEVQNEKDVLAIAWHLGTGKCVSAGLLEQARMAMTSQSLPTVIKNDNENGDDDKNEEACKL